MIVQCPHLSLPEAVTKSLQGKKIFKDQCARCFHLPSDQDGIYVCMKCFNSFCKQDLKKHYSDHKHLIYAHYLLISKQEEGKSIEITKLAIGKEGGAVGGVQYQSVYSIYCQQCKCDKVSNGGVVNGQLQSLMNTDSPFKKQSMVSWELDIFPCEHTLTLQQKPCGNKDLHKCIDCELSTNLWLCLTCGNTGCGRKNYDGSGGNNHGIAHFEKSGHPLVVKLGTITAEGQASLYCYSCNNDVKDGMLREHLDVLGISINRQSKTEKTTTELNLEINLNFTLSKLVEGAQDQNPPHYGKDFTGMNNIGNSCYLNSVVQTLNSLGEFRDIYFQEGQQHLNSCSKIPSDCFYCQTAKVSCGLNSGRYSQKNTKKTTINGKQVVQQYQKAISPYDFKLLIAQNNKEFLSNHQQDALQYFQLLLTRLQKEEPKYHPHLTTPQLFEYQHVNKQICMNCNGFKLITNKDNQWRFPVREPTKSDLEKYQVNLQHQKDVEMRKVKELEDPQYQVSFQECLNSMKGGSVVISHCSKCGGNTQFLSKWYFKSTPKYLMSVCNRFVEENWVPKKLNALIQFNSEVLDITPFLLSNSQEGSFQLNDQQNNSKYSQEKVQMLVAMGYHKNAAIRALIAQNDDIQGACNWIIQNLDKDINGPIQQPNQKAPNIDLNALNNVMEMGFDQTQAKVALNKYKNNVQQSLQWLFTVEGDVSQFIDLLKPKQQKGNQKMELEQKIYNKYELFAVIVHLGKSVHSGHYVTFLKRQNKWTLFNDQKVTLPSKPAINKGYLFVFRGI